MKTLPFSALLFFFLLFSCLSFAQTVYTLKINYTDESAQEAYRNKFSSSSERIKELQKILFKLYDAGYLAASFDSLSGDTINQSAWLHTGKKYEWASLHPGNVDEEILSSTGYREKLFRNRPFHYREAAGFLEKIIRHCENNGFPFASIRMDSVQMEENKISAVLLLEKHHQVTIDSVVVNGNARIAPVYLYSYLGIKPGKQYHETAVQKISTRIRELPFLKESAPAQVIFLEKNAKIYLFLENKRASRFDGIIGVLPDQSRPGKVNITADARLRLQNSFGAGELIDLGWKTPLPKTQDLKVKFVYPFLFSTPFGADLNFALYKKDSTYLDLVRNLGVQYHLTGGNYLKIFVNNKSSSLISTKGLEFSPTLPPYADISSTLYGLGYKTEKLDYRLNPRRGYYFEGTAGLGNRSIKKNSVINPVLYDSLDLNTTQYQFDYSIDTYCPLFKKSTINIGLEGAHLQGAQVFQNELFRFGGLKTLRGFDEEAIRASSFHVLTLEYRYLLEQNSNFFIFWNGGWYESKSRTGYVKDTPFGFGAGSSFETKLGIFSISYALGKEFNNPIYFRSAKIHFGILNYF